MQVFLTCVKLSCDKPQVNKKSVQRQRGEASLTYLWFMGNNSAHVEKAGQERLAEAKPCNLSDNQLV